MRKRRTHTIGPDLKFLAGAIKKIMPHRAKKAGAVPSFLDAVFHGPFIFVIYANRVEALTTDIKERIVGAGTFQSERP